MKHNQNYEFDRQVTTIKDVVDSLNILTDGNYDYIKITMADNTIHTFIKHDTDMLEVPDMNTALAYVVNNLFLLFTFVENGKIREADDV